MSEQHVIGAWDEKELPPPALMRDEQGDVLDPVTEVEQMFATVRQQLTELISALRSDLEELRRLISEPPPMLATSLPDPPDATRPHVDRRSALHWRHRERTAADASRHVIDSRSGVEIERKFIVKELSRELDRFPSERISQGYVAIGEGGLEVRLRRRGEHATLTVKKGLGRTRREEEIGLAPEQFQRLWPLTEGRRVEKVRYLIPTDDGLTIELDSYGDELDGLATAEVEFDSEARADAFTPPTGLGPRSPTIRAIATRAWPATVRLHRPAGRRSPLYWIWERQQPRGFAASSAGRSTRLSMTWERGSWRTLARRSTRAASASSECRPPRGWCATSSTPTRTSERTWRSATSVDTYRAHATARCWLKPWTRSARATPSSSLRGVCPPTRGTGWRASGGRATSAREMRPPGRPSSPSCAPHARGLPPGASGTTPCPRSHPVSSASTAAPAAHSSPRAGIPPTRASTSYASAPRTSGMPPRFSDPPRRR